MKLIIFGASGGTGQELVKQAMAAGHDVTVFVRTPSRLMTQHTQLKVVQGDVGDVAQVAVAVQGHDVVISALGARRDSPKDLMATSAATLIAAMQTHGVRRLIWLTGAGVSDVGDGSSFVRTLMVGLMKLLSPQVLADSTRAFQVIKASDLDWTVVRAPRLKDGAKAGGYRAGFTPPGGKALARADAAEFMLQQLSDPTYVRKAPLIGY